MTIMIHTTCEKLSDGSEAFTVFTHDDEMPSGEVTRYDTVSEKDALSFASKLHDAIVAHTIHSVGFA